MPATLAETVVTADRTTMGAHLAVPDAGSGPGLVVLQEIFGVNDYLRTACERLAGLGIVALAPDLFHRIEPGIDIPHTEEHIPRALELGRQLDHSQAVRDALDALAVLRARPEVTGGAGAFGFCLGGALAYEMAVAGDPEAAVCYYGSSIPDRLDDADRVTCPILLHFGGEDPYIGREGAERVAAAAEGRPGWEVHIHEGAGHAFDNHDAPMFHQPEPAARAWEITRDFLARTLLA
jgi:carboxymethylenebutenolidase